ncbi:MAG TPA: hypothetical protein EYP40_00525, partial [Chromatiales bacterium]|nr:hypothetical protein [Chromatiales bacterium]
MPNTIVLKQQGLFSSRRRFELRDNRYLFVHMKGVKQAQDYQLDLLALDPRSRLRITLAWPWLLAAAVVLLLLLGMTLLPDLAGDALANHVLLLTLGLSLLAFLFLLLGIARSCIERVYVARNTGYPLVRLWPNKPDKNACKTFTRQLEAAIEEVYENVPVDNQQRLAGEIKMLRRLMGHKVVTSRD